MIRSAIGAFDAILGTAGVNGLSGRLAGRQLLVRRITTRSPQGPVPWHDRMAVASNTRQLWTRRLERPKRFTSQACRAPSGRAAPRRPFHSTKTRRSAEGAKEKEPEPNSLSARLKKLSREYGWAAVGVYLTLSVLDFPFCFLLVRTLGTERIG